MVAKSIAMSKKIYTGGEYILPCTKDICRKIFEGKSTKKITNLLLCVTTINRKVHTPIMVNSERY